MARLAWVVPQGLPHHATQRGSRRQQVFFREEDYQAYLEMLAEWCAREGASAAPSYRRSQAGRRRRRKSECWRFAGMCPQIASNALTSLMGDTIRLVFAWGHDPSRLCLGTRSRFKRTNRVMSPQIRGMSPQNAHLAPKGIASRL
jgi:hypothetical protein